MTNKIYILRIQYEGETMELHFLEKEKAKYIGNELAEMVKQDNGNLFKSMVVITVHGEYTMDSIPPEMVKHIIKGAYSEYTNGRNDN